MKNISLILLLTALTSVAMSPAAAQEPDEDSRTRTIVRRIQLPSGTGASAVVVDGDGEATVVGPDVEIIGDGNHWVHFAGHRRHIGVQLTPLTPELRRHFGVSSDVGIMVSKTLEGQPAGDAGVEVGDIITAVNGDAVDSASDLTREIHDTEKGDTVDLEIWRDGSSLELSVPVAQRDPGRMVKIDVRERVDGTDRRVFVLPEIRMRDFQVDGEWLEKLGAGEWEGALRIEDIQDVLERLGEHFSSEEWRERLHHIESMDFESVEKKMKEVEKRLQNLEKELEKAEGEKL